MRFHFFCIQQQINQQIHRLKNNSIPELENKLRKRKKEFTKTGSMKAKNDIEYIERQLQDYGMIEQK